MDVGVGSGDVDATSTARAVRRGTSLQRRGPGLSDTLRVDVALFEVDEQPNGGSNEQSSQMTAALITGSRTMTTDVTALAALTAATRRMEKQDVTRYQMLARKRGGEK
ncbi:hypothetical protein DVH05_001191 [Phytophthora capsici]|nr:hypothetical protein DVH05_001191 [Phytophthora capsici]